MRYKKLIQQVNDVLKQEYNQSEFYDRVTSSLFIFNLIKKYHIQLDNNINKYLRNLLLDKTVVMSNYDSMIYKDLSTTGLVEFNYDILIPLFKLYIELDTLRIKEFLDEYFEELSSKNIDQNTSLDSIIELSKEVLSISDNSSVLDLCSGYGRFLSSINNTSDLTGIEISNTVRVVSKIYYYFSNINDETIYPQILEGDALTSKFDNKKYDYVFCEIPFGLKLSSRFVDKISENSFFPIVNNSLSSAWLFVDQVLRALNVNGKAVIVMNNSPLYKYSDYDYRISLALSGHLEMVIGLPEKLLSSTNVPINLLVLNKKVKKPCEIKLINASNEFTKGRRFNTLSTENISNIIDMIESNYRIINIDELEFSSYNLNPRDYESLIQVINPIKIKNITTDIFRGVQINSKVLDVIVSNNMHTYKLLRLSDINDYSIDFKKLLKINADHKRWERYLLEEGDFVISVKGTLIKTAVISNLNNEKIIPEGNLMVLRLKTDLISPYYLKIFFNSPIGKTILDRMRYRSSVLSISKSSLSDTEITLIDMPEQEKLVDKYFELIDEYNYHLYRLDQLETSILYLFGDDDLGGE